MYPAGIALHCIGTPTTSVCSSGHEGLAGGDGQTDVKTIVLLWDVQWYTCFCVQQLEQSKIMYCVLCKSSNQNTRGWWGLALHDWAQDLHCTSSLYSTICHVFYGARGKWWPMGDSQSIMLAHHAQSYSMLFNSFIYKKKSRQAWWEMRHNINKEL